MKKHKIIILLIITALAFCGKAEGGNNLVDEIMSNMTLTEMIGQMFIVRPQAVSYSADGYIMTDKTTKEVLNKYPVGGVCLFANNIETEEQTKKLINNLQELSNIPMFVSVDEEGGRVARVAGNAKFNVPKIKPMADYGALGDSMFAYTVGVTLGEYLLPLGFNVDFAPVADVNSNPNNEVIGNRSYSSDPSVVSEMVLAEVKGLKSTGMISCLKHFPGHGDTASDTHSGYASVHKTLDELYECELKPYIDNKDQVDMVMISHITLTNAGMGEKPASINEDIVTGLLRNTIGFNGVIITDAFEMGAISKFYEPDEAAIMAINAGCDIVLLPKSLSTAFDGVVKAVEEGQIPIERIKESVQKILELKVKYGIIK